MAWIFADSFDFYATATDFASGHWDSSNITNTAGAIVTTPNTRFTAGQGLQIGSSTDNLTKASATNDAGHHLVMAYKNLGSSNNSIGFGVTLYDGVTAQCSVGINQATGAIILTSGLFGAVLATFNANLAVNVWTGIEVEVVIHPTAGTFKVRLNGSPTDNFSATGLNTRGGTANSYANKIRLGCNTATSNYVQIDDFMWFSTGGAAPNTWVGDVRAVQQLPVSDASIALTASPATPGFGPTGQSSIVPPAANTINFSPTLLAAYGGSATALTVSFIIAYTGKYKLALYDASAGIPGTLIAQTAEVINALGGAVTLPFITPVAISIGQRLVTAVMADASIQHNGVNVANNGGTTNRAYTLGFPTAGSITTANNYSPVATITVTASNASMVAQATQDGDTSFVYGGTAGTADFYNVSTLPTAPASVVAIQTRVMARKSDTAARVMRTQIKSGAAISASADIALGSSYTFISKVDTVDPNTGSAWTAAAINALQIGPYVVS